jgi:Outer membrane protein beta-barrel domain
MCIRVLVAALVMLFAVGSVNAQGFYVGAGADFYMYSEGDALDDGGFSSSFIGITPKLGYQVNDMWGVNAGYKYFLTNEGDAGDWNMTAISIAANVAPFKDGGLMPLYFIGGIDMITVEYELPSVTVPGLGTFGGGTIEGDETGIAFGAGYGWWMSDKFSINPEVTYVTGDAGGINIEVGARLYFGN